MEPFAPIPGKPPRKVVIDRQRKLFASLDIEELLLEFVSSRFTISGSHIELHGFSDLNTHSIIIKLWPQIKIHSELKYALITDLILMIWECFQI